MDRRDFLKHVAAGLAGATAMNSANGQAAQSDVAPKPFLLSGSGCGRATGYAETNKIVTVAGKTHVAWLDSVAEGFVVRARTLDRSTGVWAPTYTVGPAYDNHGGPALTVDSKGYLHIIYFPHHHPFRYRRSKRPNDASEWEDEVQLGQRCSYPTVLVGPDDTLYMTCRESRSDKPWLVNLYSRPAGGSWEGPVPILIADEPGYSHFQEALAWSPDRQTMHLSTRMYGGRPGRAHTVGYMRSRDLGRSWERADGTTIELPGTSRSISVIAADRSKRGRGFRCGSIAVDPEGTPHVLYSDSSCRPAQAWIATPTDTGEWARRGLLEPVANALGQWSVGMPGGLAFGGNGRVHVALTLQAYASVEKAGQGWGSSAQEVVRLESGDGAHWSAAMCSHVDAKRPNWLPNIERPTGCNAVARPGLIYTSGTPGKSNKDILSNGVYWVQ